MSNLKFKINHNTKHAEVEDIEAVQYYDSPVPGMYEVIWTRRGFASIPNLVVTPVNVPTSYQATVSAVIDVKEVENLFSEKRIRICNQLGVNNKIGYLLHGKQGSGKTTTLLSIAKYFIENHNAMVFLVRDDDDVNYALQCIKEMSKMTSIIPVILHDECEDQFKDHENFFKEVLDGVKSPENLIYLAATNYIDKIPETIKDRPSRFKYVIEWNGFTGPDSLIKVLEAMNEALSEEDKLTRHELLGIAETHHTKTMDEIKHIFITMVFSKEAVLDICKEILN